MYQSGFSIWLTKSSFAGIGNEVSIVNIVNEADHSARRAERVTLRDNGNDIGLTDSQALEAE